MNLPTPLVIERLGPWPKTAVGLHVVNDLYNGMLVTYTYHEGQYYNVPHLQLAGIEKLADRARKAWLSVTDQVIETMSPYPSRCGGKSQ